MSFAQFIPNLPTVILSNTLSAAVLMSDLENQLGLDFGSVHTFTVDLWEGPSDPDDYASLSVAAGTPTLTAFDSAPGAGATLFILDIFWS